MNFSSFFHSLLSLPHKMFPSLVSVGFFSSFIWDDESFFSWKINVNLLPEPTIIPLPRRQERGESFEGMCIIWEEKWENSRVCKFHKGLGENSKQSRYVYLAVIGTVTTKTVRKSSQPQTPSSSSSPDTPSIKNPIYFFLHPAPGREKGKEDGDAQKRF